MTGGQRKDGVKGNKGDDNLRGGGGDDASMVAPEMTPATAAMAAMRS